ncbi:hypothetical protein [Sphingobium indicum]|nr:hypothetical protein [Sphingobium indicum]NYI22632.1 hypothetical protein [Sphingobium indicum]
MEFAEVSERFVKASPELEPSRQPLLEQDDGWMDADEIREIIAEPRS